jgi:hypothetical protein
MAFSLSKLLQGIYLQLGQYQVRKISTASITTLTDASLAAVGGQDDSWKDGGIFIKSSVADISPDGEFQKIAGYLESSGQFSFADSFSSSPSVGDRYGLVSAYYPIETMVEMANAGLRELGSIPLVEELTFQHDKTNGGFVTSVNLKSKPPFRIDVEASNAIGENIVWQRIYQWDYLPSLPGGVGMVLIPCAIGVGKQVRVWTMASHPTLVNHDDVVAEVIDPVLAEKVGVVHALSWQNARLGGGDAYLLARLFETKKEYEKLKILFPIWRPTKVANHLIAGV